MPTRVGRRAPVAAPVLSSAREWWAGAGLRLRLVVALTGLVVLALAGWLVWWLITDEQPRARVYGEATACLLTPAAGLSAPGAGEVWSVMQEVSLRTQAKVQYLEVDGPQTADNARSYLSSLIQNRCDVIVAIGAAPTKAATIAAPAYPQVRFAVVGVPGTGSPSDVTAVPDMSPASRQRLNDVLSGELNRN